MRLTSNFAASLAISPVCFSQEWKSAELVRRLAPQHLQSPPLRPSRVASRACCRGQRFSGRTWPTTSAAGPLPHRAGTNFTTGNAGQHDGLLQRSPASRDPHGAARCEVPPFVSAGAGTLAYGRNRRLRARPALIGYALLQPVNQVEPAIDLGGGPNGSSGNVQPRAEFRSYLTPLPDHRSALPNLGYSRLDIRPGSRRRQLYLLTFRDPLPGRVLSIWAERPGSG